MDFLKSAVASAISKGPPFPYSFGDRVDLSDSIWTLHNGTRKEDGSKCSILSFDVQANKSRLPLARNAARKLRTLRHPGVIKVLDSVETEQYIYIATERLVPLTWHIKRKSLAEETIKWGLHSVAKTVKFINEDASSVHGSLRVASIFMGESGEWKLGGFDILSSMKEDDAVIYPFGSLVPDSGRYSPPEVANSGWEAIKKNPLTAVDAYNFGILIFEVCNGSFNGREQLSQLKAVPPSMQQSYRRLVNANPKTRSTVGQFLDQGERSGGFFQTPLIHITDAIENLGLKSDDEREEFLGELDELSDDFPEEFFKMKVLPELLKSVEFGGGGAKVFGMVVKISSKLSEEEYEMRMNPVIVRLFGSPDRAMRVCLLDNLPFMIDHLPPKLVNDKIFPQMVTGFTDVAPVVREQTLKAVLTIVPKLSDRTVNGELLRYLAKTANDDQPGIRTNTTICLGKLARNLNSSSRSKILVAAFSRALRDPFIHARNAALMALAATSDVFSEEDGATKILPAISPSLVDKEKLIRDQANKTLDIYMQRIRKYAQTLPDTALQSTAGTSSSNTPRIGNDQSDSSSWAGWAISSFTNKLTTASGEMQTVPNGVSPNGTRPSSVPPPADARKPSPNPLNARGLNPSQLKKSHSSTGSPNPFNAPVVSTPTSDQNSVDEDAMDAWGDFEDEPTETKKDTTADDFDMFASSAAPRKTSATITTYEDKGEPDFAGWLSAQKSSKKAKPLPTGLKKAPASRSGTGTKSTVIGGSTVRKSVVSSKPTPAPQPKPTSKKAEKQDDEDEGWGDAWE
ncbi:kinase family protein-like protein [Eremomyces bilateralis CBS 781.70]|uniref:Kinase family protein-like protein n=1 Tax=Eremomyces bilateralis CBS 781.70 TaxID=1392243 RepID=A0A6G1FWX3_9PEZI|nr:kinase family protein-like protein [Eremomyces bilateralis CBS 781.70]KAF1810191.1 kinase family protein-like protein [Eremomyces bilateralis CBS 781.70]